MGNINHRIRERSLAAILAISALLVVGTLAGATPANALADPGTGSISGTITQDIKGVVTPSTASGITVFTGEGQRYAGYAQVDGNGHYSVGSLAAGSYVLYFGAGSSATISEFYDNATSFASAQRVVVAAGKATAGIDAVLEAGSTVTGKVTATQAGSTQPIANVSVTATDSTAPSSQYQSWSYYAQTDSAGEYSLTGLAAGTYKIRFVSSDSGVVSKWYTDSIDFTSATTVTVGAQSTLPGIDVNLQAAGAISGTVTQTLGGVPKVAQSYVDVYSAESGDYVTGAPTKLDGSYSIGSLMAGTYKVGFVGYDSNSGLVPEYFDNASTLASAKPLTVGVASTVANIDAELSDVPLPTNVTRLSGSDRFETSSAISAATFDPGVSVAYVASGSNFPDALSVAPVGGKDKAPVLLVPSGFIPAPIQAELTRLKPQRIVVLGSAASVSDTVFTALQGFTTGTVTRTAGTDRFATSAAVSAIAFSPEVPVVYIANGYNFPDALSAAPVAGKSGAAVLLVPADRIPAVIQDELTRLKPGRVVVLGGFDSVSESVATALQGYTTGTVTRIAGGDRFATSAAISQSAFDPGVPVVYVANGFNFPDALSVAPVAGIDKAPVLLVPEGWIPAAIQAELTRLKPGRIVVLGGPTSVSSAVAQQLDAFAVAP
ncbi:MULTISPECIES: cell wall-binding repeat-containing protein [unclassified Cryobacterium]|uniref:cell wall-binding repeat-containing protein n=1 Tax=unclassified Cryobacterium TaxID=2649013 RepID=UPI002AB3B85D|nr:MULTISPECIES: cell wall-binding repeat-containing protein [unclassified Cryobacterium]MDY7542552.1 cell wall-binding repeat-containing protein [Cryobacterium sp. 5B3]MEB0264673.1 cell wall-binding repeat-containing protein [Cryobacterium sp. 10I5]MEB0275169.1 cell wall-binding repeat-containing protein [Cryobacterium sp. 5B3]